MMGCSSTFSRLLHQCLELRNQFHSILVLKWLSRLHNSVPLPLLSDILRQVLGRKSPFPLILLPQFGGYWIEGTNHELSDAVDAEQLQPLSPNTRTKLECNTTATIYRKHFLSKVSHFVILGVVCGVPQISFHCLLVRLIPYSAFPSKRSLYIITLFLTSVRS